jgi:hypothetical protein
MKLKTKLTLALLLLAVMVGGAGGFGLWYVNRVANTAEVFSETAAPVLNEAMSLMNSLQGMHISLLEALYEF